MKTAVFALALPLIAGCASSSSVNQAHVDAAHQSVAMADRYSRGPSSQLDQAHHALTQAEYLAKTGHGRQADLMYLQADTDARIATAQAIQACAQVEAQRLQAETQKAQSRTAELCGPPQTPSSP